MASTITPFQSQPVAKLASQINVPPGELAPGDEKGSGVKIPVFEAIKSG